ncbi:MAG: hypothetical protein AB1898_13620 [Acidobacteriota bacterium]
MKKTVLFGLILAGLIEVSQAAPHVVSGPLVVSENWPECTTLQTWTRDVMRLEQVENAPDTAQAKVFFRWLRLFSKMATGGMIQAHEGPYGKEQYVLDAHKNLFVYGWGYCDTHSRIAEAAWSEFKGDRSKAERVVVQHPEGGYHTMYRLKLDGRYGAFDARYGYYLIERDTPDARILDWAEVGVDENILGNRAFKYRSEPFFEYFGREWERALAVEPRYFQTEEEWVAAGRPAECVFGNGQYLMGTPLHDMGFQMSKGTTIERFWDNSARKFYVPAGFESKGEEPFRPSGRFYRVTETMFDGNWMKFDPNYRFAKAYLVEVPANEGYNSEVSGGKTIGQAWGQITHEPDWQNPQFLQVTAIDTDFRHHTTAPYLQPATLQGGGTAVFDYYSPYVLVDGTLMGEWLASPKDQVNVEIRTLLPKPRQRDEPDVWSPWQSISSTTSPFKVDLGRARFNGRDVSLHGVYRFQLRFSMKSNSERTTAVGLKALKLRVYFETGLMSIPRIVAGPNTIHFKVVDSREVRAPVEVVYRYRTSSGSARHRQVIQPDHFHNNVATYRFEAPGLTRCDSLLIRY